VIFNFYIFCITKSLTDQKKQAVTGKFIPHSHSWRANYRKRSRQQRWWGGAGVRGGGLLVLWCPLDLEEGEGMVGKTGGSTFTY